MAVGVNGGSMITASCVDTFGIGDMELEDGAL